MAAYRRFAGRVARAALAAALYLAFAAKLDGPECCMAALAAALALTAMHQLRRLDHQRQEFVAPPLRWLVHVAGRMMSDSWLVASCLATSPLARTIGGRLRRVPFDSGDDDPRAAARRTLVTLGKSFAPNEIVIAIDRPNRRLLAHQLVPRDGSDNRSQEWPA